MDFSRKFVCECEERSSLFSHVRAPLFRKSFDVQKKPETAEILICGLGFYDLYINGKKITKGYLAPYISNPDHIAYYDKYDLKPYLKTGENVIGVMLGDGFMNGKSLCWDFKDNIFNSSPKLALSVNIDGKVFEADSFKCKKGPITFNDIRCGVFYDARLEEDGWNDAGFKEDESWHEPLCSASPRGKCRISQAENICITKQIKPVKIFKGGTIANKPREDTARWLETCPPTVEGPVPSNGGYIYDFGENNAGIFRLKIKGTPGQKINFQLGEALDGDKLYYTNIAMFFPDGYCQRDIYILKGDKEEIYEPQFVYHGFRYIYVEGITEEQATEDLLTYLVMSSDLEERGSFECSDEISNKLYEMGRRSDISNFYYFPTDCPHREKNGWTGDASVSADHMMLTIGAEESYREWLCNIRLAQREDGMIPGIVPTDTWGYDWGSGPTWDSVLFNLPYVIYKYRGDTEVIKENSHAMLRYLDFVSKRRDERGIVEYGLGDWVPVSRAADDYEPPLGFTDSTMVYYMCTIGAEMFEKTGNSLAYNFAKQLGAEMLEAIRREYIDFNTMTVMGDCQSSQAIAIYFNVFKESEKPAAFKKLLEIIKRDGECITSGFLGLRTIFRVLSDFGESELAYKMITRKEYPGYGYWVEKGETTLLESFAEYDKYYTASANHHFLGDIIAWYMIYPGGLKVINDKRVKIKPHFLSGMSYAKASHKLPSGEVSVYWRRDGEDIYLDVTCPDGVRIDIEVDGEYMFEKYKRTHTSKAEKNLKVIKRKNAWLFDGDAIVSPIPEEKEN